MFSHHTFWLPKRGSRDDEYEDAHAISYTHSSSPANGHLRCAVADGATEASFSGVWAEILAQHYARTGGFDASALPALGEQWLNGVMTRSTDKPLPWYVEEKLGYGAFAALIGFHANPFGGWTATAAGDCCLFHIRLGRIIKAFPLESADAFNSRPALLSTHPAHNAGVEIVTHAGSWLKHDRFFLMSDALAQFTLMYPEAVKKLASLKPELFAPMVERLRDEKRCRNDDVTFIRIQMLAAPLERKSEHQP
jgi:hypothetical protein